VLALFSKESPRLTMSDVVERTGFNKSTAFRILSTLEQAGYLQRDEETRHYTPSFKVLTLGFTAINTFDVRQFARPYLEKLAQELDLTASLGVLDGVSVVYMDRIRNREIVGILLGLGDRIPAHCSSMGKVMLAHLPLDELERRLAAMEFAPCTPRTVVDVDTLRQTLVQIREVGYATNDEELVSGLRAVAAPDFAPPHRPRSRPARSPRPDRAIRRAGIARRCRSAGS